MRTRIATAFLLAVLAPSFAQAMCLGTSAASGRPGEAIRLDVRWTTGAACPPLAYIAIAGVPPGVLAPAQSVGPVEVTAPISDPAFVTRLAVLGNGHLAAAWNVFHPSDDGTDAYFRVIAPNGTLRSGVVRMHDDRYSHQGGHTVFPLRSGDLVAFWTSKEAPPANPTDQSFYRVFARTFSPEGTPREAQREVSPDAVHSQSMSSVSQLPSGPVVILWGANERDGSGGGLYARLDEPFGTPRIRDYRINVFTRGEQDWGMFAAGGANVIAVWRSQHQDGDEGGIYGMRFDAELTPQDTEFRVNTTTEGWQSRPHVRAFSDGAFVVAWNSYNPATRIERGMFQLYDADGRPVGPERSFGDPLGIASMHALLIDDKEFLLAWQQKDGTTVAQRYGRDGAPAGPLMVLDRDRCSQMRFAPIEGGFAVLRSCWTSGVGTVVQLRVYGRDGGAMYVVPAADLANLSVTPDAAVPPGRYQLRLSAFGGSGAELLESIELVLTLLP